MLGKPGIVRYVAGAMWKVEDAEHPLAAICWWRWPCGMHLLATRAVCDERLAIRVCAHARIIRCDRPHPRGILVFCNETSPLVIIWNAPLRDREDIRLPAVFWRVFVFSCFRVLALRSSSVFCVFVFWPRGRLCFRVLALCDSHSSASSPDTTEYSVAYGKRLRTTQDFHILWRTGAGTSSMYALSALFRGLTRLGGIAPRFHLSVFTIGHDPHSQTASYSPDLIQSHTTSHSESTHSLSTTFDGR